jgi:hypothetical protein
MNRTINIVSVEHFDFNSVAHLDGTVEPTEVPLQVDV